MKVQDMAALILYPHDHPANKLFELFPGNIDLPEKLTSFGELGSQEML